MQVIRLGGCSPTPLAHYLKALGILRLLGEQLDASVRGFWKNESFHLVTELTEDAVVDFFLLSYRPTPLIAPWNGGSGFYPKDNSNALDAISRSKGQRLAPYRQALQLAREEVERLSEAPKGDEKAALFRRLRQKASSDLIPWFDAAVSIKPDGTPSFPSLLGTGGNDGRLDFTNNFMQRICEVLEVAAPDTPPSPHSRLWLRSSLFGDTTRTSKSFSIGQFLPGAVGGANSSDEWTSKSPQNNPWDFLLAFEGATCFRSSVTRRASLVGQAQAAAPFATRSLSASYGSATTSDESARGEQWMPLWNRPAAWSEVDLFLREGRSRVPTGIAYGATDFARALTRMGTARGVTAFQRYGYQERNGQANLAVPLERWTVRQSKLGHLVDEVSTWLVRLGSIAGRKNAPATYERRARACKTALMTAMRDSSPSAWQNLLIQLVRAERLALASPKFAAEHMSQPLPRLSAQWLEALDDGSVDYRLAAALASLEIRDPLRRRSVRCYWLPLTSDKHPRFDTSESALCVGPEVVAHGRSLTRDSTQVLLRRCTEPNRPRAHLGLFSRKSYHARLEDIALFLSGEMDDEKCLTLAMGMMALDWSRVQAPQRAAGTIAVPSSYALLKLALPLCPHPGNSPEAQAPLPLPTPAMVHRLSAGDAHGAFSAARFSLNAAGLRPKAHIFVANQSRVQRLGAALLFPLAQSDLARLRQWLVQPESSGAPPTADSPPSNSQQPTETKDD